MSMKTRFSSLLSLSLVASLALAPTTVLADDDDPEVTVYKKGSVPLKKPAMNLQPIPEYSIDSQLFNFPTGLRILMQSDQTHPVVTFHSMVNHGSGDDPPGMGGLAHFTEHTWFKSEHTYVEPITGRTDVIPKMKIMDLQGYIGAVMNATTFADYTDYKTTASAEFTDLLMQYESWRLAEPYAGIVQDEIDVEVNVILNEWRRRNEQSSALFQDLAPKAIYPPDHPYANRSTKETLEKITLEDLQGFFDRHYQPHEATVVVVGDFTPLEASSLIFRNFDWKLLDPELDKEKDMWIAPKPGVTIDPNTPKEELDPDDFLVGAFTPDSRDLPASERPRYEYLTNAEWETEFGIRVPKEPDTAPTPSGENRVLKAKAPFEKDAAVAIWALPGGYRQDEYTLRGLGTYASVVISNNMEPGWRGVDPYPDLEFGGCGSWPSKLNTMMFCFVEFDPDKDTPQNALDKVVGQVYHMMDPVWIQINENYIFNRFRAQYMRDILFNVDRAATPFGGRAEDIGKSLHFSGDPAAHSSAIQAVSGFDATDMAKLVEKHLKRDRYAILHIEPLPEEERDTNASGSAYAGAAGEDNLIEGEAGLAKTLTAEQVADSWVEPKLDDLEEFYLDNGMRVIVLDHGETPLVRGTLIIGGGQSMKPNKEFDYYWKMRNWDWQTNDVLEFAGLQRQWAEGNNEYFDVTAPSGNLDSVVYTLRNYVDTVKADMQGNSLYGRRYRNRILRLWSSPQGHLSTIRSEHLYPGFEPAQANNIAYGYDLAEGGRPTVEKYIDGRFQPENATLLLVGARPVEDMKRVAYDMFSSWKKTGEVMDIDSFGHPDMPPEDAGRKIVLADDKGATQSEIRAACRLEPLDGDYEMAIQVLGSIVRNDTFGTLRVKEGLGYSPGAYAGENYEGAPFLLFYALATNAGVGRVVEYFYEWVENHEEGFDPDIVAAHKLRIAREAGIEAQSVGQMTAVLRGALEEGRSFDDVRTVGDRIASVTPEDLQKLLQGCSDHMVTTISGPESVLKPKLEEKGFEFEELDWRERRDTLYEGQFAKSYIRWKKKHLKDLAKLKKQLSRKCKADPESRACDKLQKVIVEEREERERERKSKSSSGITARLD